MAVALLAPAPAQGAAGDKYMELVFEVRDTDLQKLRDPWIRLDDDKVEPFPLKDDGLGADTGPADHLWTGGIKMVGSPKVVLTLEDRGTGKVVGSRTLFLPVAKQARIILFVVEGEPGLLLLSERKEQLAAQEQDGTATTRPVDSSDSAAERFVYLLWVLLLLGLLGLGYLRVVVRRFLADFMPTWRKLGRFLDREFPPDEGDDG